MAIAYDTGTRASRIAATSHTISHTITGSNPFLTVGFTIASGATCSGVTWNGVAMTKSVDLAVSQNGVAILYIFTLGAADTGTHDVVATFTASKAADFDINSFTGCQSSSAVDSSNTGTTASASSLTVSTTTVADNCWLVGQCKDGRGDASGGTNTTIRAGGGTGSGDVSCSTSTAQTPAGSKSLQITWGGATPADFAVISVAPFVASTFIPCIIIT